MYFYTPNTGNVYSEYMYNSSMVNNMKQAEPFDPFSNTDIGGAGAFLAVTPNTGRNTSTPFFMHVMHMPDPGIWGSNYGYLYMDGWRYHYQINGTRNYTSSLNTSLGSNWVYSYRANYYSPQASSGYHGLISYTMYLSNTAWTGYNANNPITGNYYSDRYMYGLSLIHI